MKQNMHNVVAETGRFIETGVSRYEADQALFAANERACVVQLFDDGTSRRVNDNYEVFPLEPEVKSAWIAVGDKVPDTLINCLVLAERFNGRRMLVAYRNLEMWFTVNQVGRSDRVKGEVTHWTNLPPLP